MDPESPQCRDGSAGGVAEAQDDCLQLPAVVAGGARRDGDGCLAGGLADRDGGETDDVEAASARQFSYCVEMGTRPAPTMAATVAADVDS